MLVRRTRDIAPLRLAPLAALPARVLFALVAAVSFCARPSAACGGLFCSSTPIDQTAEHIVFAVNGDSTITAYVQISYAGQRDAFAWIIPVPSNPVLGTFPRAAMQALDQATQPLLYPNAACALPVLINGGGSVVSPTDVTVYSQATVGPYDTVVIGGTNATSLVDWLRSNGYVITDPMIPLIDVYAREGLLFLALKLSPDKDVTDIAPIVMTYTGTEPMVPLRLTAVAARPQMGVVVWILADRRYGPKNYADLEMSDEELVFVTGANNYAPLVSRKVAAASGHGFLTEYAGPVAPLVDTLNRSFVQPGMQTDARDQLVALLGRFDYITRLYTKLSPADMTVDPTFVAAAVSTDVSNVHDRRPVPTDAGACSSFPPCEASACGTHGTCVRLAAGSGCAGGMDACICEPGAVASITASWMAGSSANVACQPEADNLMPAAMNAGACSGFDCGVGGECVAINGVPSCRCAPGFAASAPLAYGGTSLVPVLQCVPMASDADAQCSVVIPPPPRSSDAGVSSDAGPITLPGLDAASGSSCACVLSNRDGPAGTRGAFAFSVLAVVAARRHSRRARLAQRRTRLYPQPFIGESVQRRR
jgi:hypothetical protein